MRAASRIRIGRSADPLLSMVTSWIGERVADDGDRRVGCSVADHSHHSGSVGWSTSELAAAQHRVVVLGREGDLGAARPGERAAAAGVDEGGRAEAPLVAGDPVGGGVGCSLLRAGRPSALTAVVPASTTHIPPAASAEARPAGTPPSLSRRGRGPPPAPWSPRPGRRWRPGRRRVRRRRARRGGPTAARPAAASATGTGSRSGRRPTAPAPSPIRPPPPRAPTSAVMTRAAPVGRDQGRAIRGTPSWLDMRQARPDDGGHARPPTSTRAVRRPTRDRRRQGDQSSEGELPGARPGAEEGDAPDPTTADTQVTSDDQADRRDGDQRTACGRCRSPASAADPRPRRAAGSARPR